MAITRDNDLPVGRLRIKVEVVTEIGLTYTDMDTLSRLRKTGKYPNDTLVVQAWMQTMHPDIAEEYEGHKIVSVNILSNPFHD